ncbi:M20/M25/M40 family metallo-hydrolase [Aliidiomarina halalkaliphila]|uniref:Carboxypeptidase Q n=1 Tax=Aliidiomarina halalkaliphila TaxID=2593535 RepID=A0A552X4P3_9GAMM|nr:M20/M25/M40 family metallo-hydrolase [Aliidiomarina halalkaliphila]TRW49994.1 M20/M25/M40 family metallo-hydrolase [Aliidiomarina halalkaliphila]
MRFLGLLVWVLSAGFAVQASVFTQSQLETARELRDAAMQETGAFEIVKDLTTRVGPRMPGSEGDARGVAWAKDALEAMNFDRVWLEPVTFPTWTRGVETARVLGDSSQPLVVTTLGYSPATPAGGIEAQVVMFDNLAALEAASADEVRGKIVFIRNEMERSKDGSTYGPAVSARSMGPVVAAEKGAAAIVIRSISTSEHRFAHTGMVRYNWDGDNNLVPAAALANADANQLERLVNLGEPVYLHLDLQPRYGDMYTSHNVIADIKGSEKPEEVVIISAHLDSWDLSPGVLDDGVGVAIVMETAKRLLGLEERPKRTVRVILFAAEEIGLLGARAYAEKHGEQVAQHFVGSESDFGAGRVYQLNARVQDDAWPVIAAIAEEMKPLGVELGERDARGGPDMLPMRSLGMSVVDLAQDGTYYFDYHHTMNDTLDQVDRTDLNQNVAAWLVFTWLAANSPVDFGSGANLIP